MLQGGQEAEMNKPSLRAGTILALAATLILLVTAACASAPDSGPLTDPAVEATAAESTAANAAAAKTPAHPASMPDLTVDGPFPRFTPEEIVASGYPDHMHAFYWKDWTPLADDGVPYGPGVICDGFKFLDPEGLVLAEGSMGWGRFRIDHDPGWDACQIAPFLELCDYARVRVRDLLGLATTDTLAMVCADDLDSYLADSGYGNWRLFKLDGDTAILEPVPVLVARTLVGHAAVDLVTRWTLRENTGDSLPAWFEFGIAAYLADYGVHLANYMAFARQQGPVLMDVAAIDDALAAPPADDPETDRWNWRRARYCSFLMAWRLVEDNGGIAALRELLADVAGGRSFDSACRRVYDRDADRLAADLDPARLGEHFSEGYMPVNPARQPQPATAPEIERNAVTR